MNNLTFSLCVDTNIQYHEPTVTAFLDEFRTYLAQAVNSLDYDLACQLQRHEKKPPRPDATFPSLRLHVGYAYKGSRGHDHLLNGKGVDIIPIDISFNETTCNLEKIQIFDHESITAYRLVDLVAEKYRAILQQEKRNRVRRQDVYDLYSLFQAYMELIKADRQEILKSLLLKSKSRDLTVTQQSMDNPMIRQRCEKEYPSLATEIGGELPPFDEAFTAVQGFYETLPW